ncbi:uncharacterized protein [Ptychodera flava]|uniref:uncharacterized protein n=1 Tax=Ptychodera flava TaxID=63121 RepID=UPI003969EC88
MSLQPEVQRADGKDDMGDLKPRNHGQAKPHYDVSKHRQSYPPGESQRTVQVTQPSELLTEGSAVNITDSYVQIGQGNMMIVHGQTSNNAMSKASNTEIQNEDKKPREMGNMDEITNRLPESLRLSNQQPIDLQGIGDTREIQPAANMHHKVGPGGDGTTDPGLSQSGERKVKIDPKNMTNGDSSTDGQTREGVEDTHAQDSSEIPSDDTGSQPVSAQSGVSTPSDYPERVQPPTQQTQNNTQPGQDMQVSTDDQPMPSDIDASSNNQSVPPEESSSSDVIGALGDDGGSTDKDEEQKMQESSSQMNDTTGSSSTPSFDEESRLYFLKYSHVEEITDNFKTCISNEGAFGPVYEGVFPFDGPLKGRKVAVKVLNPEGEHGVKEYDREKSVAAVKHPNILPVFAVCDEGDKKCVVYPYMENKDLAHQIKEKNQQLTWKIRLAIAIGLCRAVTCLHSPTELR